MRATGQKLFFPLNPATTAALLLPCMVELPEVSVTFEAIKIHRMMGRVQMKALYQLVYECAAQFLS